MTDGSPLDPGEPVYADGQMLNRAAGSTDNRFRVETVTPDHPDGLDETEHVGGEFGEKVPEDRTGRVHASRFGSATAGANVSRRFALAVVSTSGICRRT